jgi:PAS domain S-box-containing protein
MTQKTYEELKQRVRELEAAEFEKKRTEAELRKSEGRLKVLSDASFEAIFLSEKGICIDQNLTAEKMFGYSLEEAVGRHGSEWIAPEDRKLVQNNMLLDYAAPYEVSALRKDGTTFPCEIRARNRNYDGRIVRVTALRDISDRKQAEKDREHLQAKLANAIEMAHLGPWEYDAVQDVFIFNDSFYKMFRTTAEQVGGYTMTSAEYARRFVHPDEIALVGEEIRKVMETSDPQYSRQLEHRMIYADGTFGYITVRFFIQKDANGKTIRTFGVNQDITERRQSEVALRRLNEKLGQRTELAEARAKQLQNLAMELIESEERERRRISELLHDDLQQILSAALLQLGACSENLHSISELDFAQQLLKESIAKARNLSYDLSPSVLYHSGLVAGLQRLVRQMNDKFGLTVQLDVDLHQQVDCSPAQVFIYRAVQELLFNAVKHSGVQNAQVLLANSEKALQVTVSDQGRGFDTGMLESISPRAGLGLMSLRERANYFGGILEIDSSPGQGSRFTLTLPIGSVHTGGPRIEQPN